MSLGPLATRVRHILALYDVDIAERFETIFPNTIFIGTTPNELVLLNRFWRRQFAVHDSDTSGVRIWLCDTDEPNAWIKMFECVIAPEIARLNLPHFE